VTRLPRGSPSDARPAVKSLVPDHCLENFAAGGNVVSQAHDSADGASPSDDSTENRRAGIDDDVVVDDRVPA
jgi:hypothetical protein